MVYATNANYYQEKEKSAAQILIFAHDDKNW